MKKQIKNLLLLLLIFPAMFLFTACEKDSNKQFTVTFNSNGGSLVQSVQVNEGSNLTEPTNPTKIRYVFDGWYNGDEKWSFENSLVNSDLELSARWKLNYSEGLEYEISEDLSYYILKGLGTCTDEHLVIPETYDGKPVKEIADYSIISLRLLTITIPETVEVFNPEAFSFTFKLAEIFNYSKVDMSSYMVNVEDNIDEIDNISEMSVFAYCELYTDKSQESNIFESNNMIYINSDNEKIAIAPANYELENIVIDDDCDRIALCAFMDMDFTYIMNEESEDDNLGNISKLKEITIGKNVKEIGFSAFNYCCKLEKVNFAENGLLEKIDLNAFYGCEKLEKVEIPDTVTNIEKYAFAYCTSIKELKISNSVSIIKKESFSCLYSLVNLVIPNNVNIIQDEAFAWCHNLTTVTLGENVTLIATESSVPIGEGVITQIGSSAFSGSNKILEIKNLSCLELEIGSQNNGGIAKNAKHIYKTGDSYVTVDENGFIKYEVHSVSFDFGEENYNILTGYIGDSVDIVIPSDVTSIEENAFSYRDDIVSVTISRNVDKIKENAFGGDDSLPIGVLNVNGNGCVNLEKVYYEGTSNDWANITIEDNNCNLKNATRYYYSEIQPETDGNYWHYDTDGVTIIEWEKV